MLVSSNSLREITRTVYLLYGLRTRREGSYDVIAVLDMAVYATLLDYFHERELRQAYMIHHLKYAIMPVLEASILEDHISDASGLSQLSSEQAFLREVGVYGPG